MSLPGEIHLEIMGFLSLSSLISMRSTCRYWQRTIKDKRDVLHSTRSRLLVLFEETVGSKAFPEYRKRTKMYLQPFVRDMFIERFRAGASKSMPEEFEMWIKEWPLYAAMVDTWPGTYKCKVPTLDWWPDDWNQMCEYTSSFGRRPMNVPFQFTERMVNQRQWKEKMPCHAKKGTGYILRAKAVHVCWPFGQDYTGNRYLLVLDGEGPLKGCVVLCLPTFQPQLEPHREVYSVLECDGVLGLPSRHPRVFDDWIKFLRYKLRMLEESYRRRIT